MPKINVVEAIADAKERWQANRADRVNPSRVFLGEHAYRSVHEEAEKHGVTAPLFPRFEDERLEHNGMKVHCHRSAAIEFE